MAFPESSFWVLHGADFEYSYKGKRPGRDVKKTVKVFLLIVRVASCFDPPGKPPIGPTINSVTGR